MTAAGSSEPTPHILAGSGIGSLPPWALRDSNSRHPPCKRSALRPIWLSLPYRSPYFASLFRSAKAAEPLEPKNEPLERFRKRLTHPIVSGYMPELGINPADRRM